MDASEHTYVEGRCSARQSRHTRQRRTRTSLSSSSSTSSLAQSCHSLTLTPINEQARFVVMLLCAHGCICASSGLTFNLFSGDLQVKYDFSQRQMTTIATLSSLSGMAAFPFAHLYDTAGPRPLFLLGAAALPLGALFFALTFANVLDGSVTRCVCCLALIHVGAALFDMASLMTVLAHFPRSRGAVIAVLKTFIGLGTAMWGSLQMGFFEHRPAAFFVAMASYAALVGLVCARHVALPDYAVHDDEDDAHTHGDESEGDEAAGRALLLQQQQHHQDDDETHNDGRTRCDVCSAEPLPESVLLRRMERRAQRRVYFTQLPPRRRLAVALLVVVALIVTLPVMTAMVVWGEKGDAHGAHSDRSSSSMNSESHSSRRGGYLLIDASSGELGSAVYACASDTNSRDAFSCTRARHGRTPKSNYVRCVFDDYRGKLYSAGSYPHVSKMSCAVTMLILVMLYSLVAAPIRWLDAGGHGAPDSDKDDSHRRSHAEENEADREGTGETEAYTHETRPGRATASHATRQTTSVCGRKASTNNNTVVPVVGSDDVRGGARLEDTPAHDGAIMVPPAVCPARACADALAHTHSSPHRPRLDGLGPPSSRRVRRHRDSEFVLPQYHTRFRRSIRTPTLWWLVLSFFCTVSPQIVIIPNARFLYAAVTAQEMRGDVAALLTIVLGTGSALGRLVMSLLYEVYTQRRQPAARTPLTLALFIPSLTMLVVCVMFLLLPPAWLMLAFVLTALGHGLGAATVVLVLRTLYARDVAHHYNVMTLTALAASLLMNRLLYGEYYTWQASRQRRPPSPVLGHVPYTRQWMQSERCVNHSEEEDGGSDNLCVGRRCIALPFVLMAGLLLVGLYANWVVHAHYRDYCARVWLRESARGEEREGVSDDAAEEDGVGDVATESHPLLRRRWRA